jgi:hypothetical protein
MRCAIAIAMSAYKPQIYNKKILFLKYYKPFVYILRECGKSTPHPSRKLATFPHWGRLLECLLSEMNYAAKQEFISLQSTNSVIFST